MNGIKINQFFMQMVEIDVFLMKNCLEFYIRVLLCFLNSVIFLRNAIELRFSRNSAIMRTKASMHTHSGKYTQWYEWSEWLLSSDGSHKIALMVVLTYTTATLEDWGVLY